MMQEGLAGPIKTTYGGANMVNKGSKGKTTKGMMATQDAMTTTKGKTVSSTKGNSADYEVMNNMTMMNAKGKRNSTRAGNGTTKGTNFVSLGKGSGAKLGGQQFQ